MRARSSARAVRAVALAWILNAVLGSLVGIAWLRDLQTDGSGLVLAFVIAALVSTIAMLAFVVALPFLLAAFFLRGRRVLGIAQAVAWTLFQLALYADTRIYGLFRYHFNGMVWNVMTTPGSEDAVELGPRIWLTALAIAVVLFALELLAWNRLLLREETTEAGERRLRRAAWAGCIAIGVLVIFEKGLYARADFQRDRRITALSQLFWLYQRLTMGGLAKKLGVKLEDRPRVEIGGESVLLRYPIEKPRFALPTAGAKLPNLVIVVIDSLRSDMLAETTMPRTSAFAQRARTFANHLSGGNGTRHGIFSLLYGIHGSYWTPALEEHAPPVLVTSLQQLGYDLRVISTPSMNFPEFRSNAWVTMEDDVEDHLPETTKHERDASIPGRLERWLAGRAPGKPFFAFLLIDAPHGTYDWPREETVFRPCADQVDFLKMSSSPSPAEIEEVWNSYRNAVHFADSVAGRVLDVLARAGHADDTVVAITGDHGEEFFEHGHFGHTSDFAPEQVHVTFVLRGPGIAPGVETRPTSHIDLAPTFLSLCGASAEDRGKWTLGYDLRDPPAERLRVIAAWQEVGLWTPDAILRIPLEGHLGLIEAYDYDWKRHPAEKQAIASAGAAIGKLAEECRRFLR